MPYIDKISKAGTVYDIQDTKTKAEVTDLKNALIDSIVPYNAVDLLSLYGSVASTTVSGVTFTAIGHNKYTASGTATSAAYANILHMSSGVFEAGKSYKFKVTSTSTNLRIAMFFYDSSDTIISGTSQYMTADRTITVPNSAVKTSVYVQVPNGATVTNAEIEFYCIVGVVNSDLNEKIEDTKAETLANSSDIASLQNTVFNGIVPYNVTDLVAMYGAPASTSVDGIQFTLVGKNKYQVNGTATATAYANIFHMSSGVFEVGKTYHFHISTTDSNVKLSMFFYDSSDAIISGTSQYMNTDRDVIVPEGTVKTSVYVQVPNGTSVDHAEIEFYCLTGSTNMELDDKINGFAVNAFSALDTEGSLYLPFGMWESGSAVFSTSDVVYTNDPKKIRTKFDHTIALYPGDTITMDWTKYTCRIGGKKAIGTYGYSGQITSDYTMSEIFTDVHVVVGYADETSITHVENMNALSQEFRVVRAPHVGKPMNTTWEYGGLYVNTALPYDADFSRRTGFIRVGHGSQVSFELPPDENHLLRIYQYDSSKTYIENSGSESYRSSGQIIVNDKTAFIRVTMKDYNNTAVTETFERGARIYINPIYYAVPAKPVMTIIDDDTLSLAHIQKVYTQANNEGIKMTFACEPYYVEQGNFAATLQQYEREGFHVTFHCNQQTDVYRSDSQYRDYDAMEADFVTGMQKMQDMGFIDYRYFVAPYGSHDADIIALAKKWGMKCLVSIAQRTYEPTVVSYNRWTIPRIGLNQHDADGSVTLAELKAQIDACAVAKGWLLVGTHFDTWSASEGFSRFHEVVQYAKDKGFDIVTLAEGFERWRKYYDIHDLNS